MLRALALLVGVVLLSGTGVFSQEKKDPPKDPAKDTKDAKDSKDSKDPPGKLKGFLPKYWSKLGLTDAQKQDVYRTQAKYSDQIKKLQDQLDALKEEEKQELAKVLSPEQKKRL